MNSLKVINSTYKQDKIKCFEVYFSSNIILMSCSETKNITKTEQSSNGKENKTKKGKSRKINRKKNVKKS